MALILIIAITISRTVPIYDNLESFSMHACVGIFPFRLSRSLSFARSICLPLYRFIRCVLFNVFKSQWKTELPKPRSMALIRFCVIFFICFSSFGRFFIFVFRCFQKSKILCAVIIFITIPLLHRSRLISHKHECRMLFHTCIGFRRRHSAWHIEIP